MCACVCVCVRVCVCVCCHAHSSKDRTAVITVGTLVVEASESVIIRRDHLAMALGHQTVYLLATP